MKQSADHRLEFTHALSKGIANERAARVRNVCAAAQGQCSPELIAEQRQKVRNTFLSASGKGVGPSSPDKTGARPQGKRLEHVAAGADSSIHKYRQPTADRFRYSGQYRDRRGRTVHL